MSEKEGDDGTTRKKDAEAPTTSTTQTPPADLLGQLRRAKSQLERGALETVEEQKAYKRVRKQLEEDTNGELTDTEYDTLARITMYLEIWNEYERHTPIEGINPELQQQARLYRNIIIDAMQKHRSTKQTTGNFLEQAKLGAAAARAEYGENLEIEWQNRPRSSLSEQLKKAKEVEEGQKEKSKDKKPAPKTLGGKKV
jgi:hypothetical protein